jgi:hypothetical protein
MQASVHYRSRRSSLHYGKPPIKLFGTFRIATCLEQGLGLNLCTLRDMLQNKILYLRRKAKHHPPLRKNGIGQAKKNRNKDSTNIGCSYHSK